jgi:hypothetical protein
MKTLSRIFGYWLGRFYRAFVLFFVFAFIELDIRKVISQELPKGIEGSSLDPILDIVREHFQAQFLLLPFYAVIIGFPVAAFLGRWIQKNRLWSVPVIIVMAFSYFITLEANIGLFLYWYRPGYQEVAFSMALMPLALLIFFTLDARRIIRVFLAISKKRTTKAWPLN